ncbi:uncharacterized protein KY384_001728 [Bacidia gigantensis]|uniref:uncharacterized protein n=1 Tax=Bacidia gigantensis TaxID=2732470 RepID=UPI001D05865C|nr:uncharacterized protein KY384_001728 [Bacidia gigantensis]KAG8533985.1 hypothetical protein KY384_001728 [Bacidia gigantensis]
MFSPFIASIAFALFAIPGSTFPTTLHHRSALDKPTAAIRSREARPDASLSARRVSTELISPIHSRQTSDLGAPVPVPGTDFFVEVRRGIYHETLDRYAMSRLLSSFITHLERSGDHSMTVPEVWKSNWSHLEVVFRPERTTGPYSFRYSGAARVVVVLKRLVDEGQLTTNFEFVVGTEGFALVLATGELDATAGVVDVG